MGLGVGDKKLVLRPNLVAETPLSVPAKSILCIINSLL